MPFYDPGIRWGADAWKIAQKFFLTLGLGLNDKTFQYWSPVLARRTVRSCIVPFHGINLGRDLPASGITGLIALEIKGV